MILDFRIEIPDIANTYIPIFNGKGYIINDFSSFSKRHVMSFNGINYGWTKGDPKSIGETIYEWWL